MVYHGVRGGISNEEYPTMATKTARRPERELRAIAFQIADEVETVAQGFIRAGFDRNTALTLALTQLASI